METTSYMSDWRVVCAEGFLNVLFLTKKMIPQAAGTRNKNDEKSPKSEEKFFGMQKPPRREACKKELAVGRALTEAFLKVPLGIFKIAEVMTAIQLRCVVV